MPRPSLRIRLAVCLVAVAAGLGSSAAVAHASTTHRCKSADLRYPFEPGGPKTFGVFKLRITGGRCATAHRVAKIWMEKLEASIHGSGPLKVGSDPAQPLEPLRLRGAQRLSATRSS